MTTPIKIATWNVNSLRMRIEHVKAWLARHSPDVLCLQEIKVEELKYPRAELEWEGYKSALLGQKTYNGVAILSKTKPENVTYGFGDGVEDPQSRFITATIRGVRVACAYMPNGSKVGSEKWHYKLAWMKRLGAWLAKNVDPKEPFVLCGDFNVAPEAIDVHAPAEWENETIFHPEARAALRDLRAFGLVDTFRERHPGEPDHYSWWDFRTLGFQRGRGLRIDHVDATRPLADHCIASIIDREERAADSPSDHAPVMSTFEI